VKKDATEQKKTASSVVKPAKDDKKVELDPVCIKTQFMVGEYYYSSIVE
jgi:hypothetical protein